MLKKTIAEKYDGMSKTQKKIANFILQNITAASYYNIQQLAQAVGTSEASILRFCTFLGYKGFPEFRNEMQIAAKEQMSMKDRLKISYQAFDEKEAGIAEIFHQDVNRIESTLNQLDMNLFFKTCQEIILAEKIYILAARSASALGLFFQYYLNMILGNVELITGLGCSADQLCEVSKDDVVIGITFNRYSVITEKMFRYSADHGAVTVAITDSPVSPIVKYAKYCFLTETAMPTYIDSFVAPLTLINAILTEIGRNRNIELESRLNKLDAFSNEFEIFE